MEILSAQWWISLKNINDYYVVIMYLDISKTIFLFTRWSRTLGITNFAKFSVGMVTGEAPCVEWKLMILKVKREFLTRCVDWRLTLSNVEINNRAACFVHHPCGLSSSCAFVKANDNNKELKGFFNFLFLNIIQRQS